MVEELNQIKNNVIDKFGKFTYVKRIIKSHINNGNLDKAKEKLDEYRLMFPQDIDINNIMTMLSIIENDLDEAERIALEGLKKVPFNFDLLYNLGFIYKLKKQHQKAADIYIKASKVATTDEEKRDVKEALDELRKLKPDIDFTKVEEVNHKLFPLKTDKSTYIGSPLFPINKDEGYFTQYYEGGYLGNYPVQLWNFYKTEILYGKKYGAGEKSFKVNSKSIIPISILNQNTKVRLKVNGETYNFNNLIPNRFYYFPIKNEEEIDINSNGDVIIGNPIDIEQSKKHDIKLVLCLFIDGLSQKIFDDYPIEKIMPNTYSFFKKGAIFNNCYSNAEWTLPSVASIFSGKYQAHHNIFHPELPHVIGQGYNILSEYFQDEGYFTFQACGDWRKSPSYGYVKGFDRTIYQSATMGSLCNDIIFSFLENVRAFKNRDHFAWLSFFELHRINEGLNPDISVQVNKTLKSIEKEEKHEKSVRVKYDENKIQRYVEEIRRLDYYLKLIYDFIEENYSNDEILISLFSDHGQSFLDNDTHILRDARTKVPFMIRGRHIPSTQTNDLVENVDILPTILEKCSIDYEVSELDGRIPHILGGDKKKEYVFSESKYPGQTYKAIIRDEFHTVTFESEGNVQSDGRFILGNFSIKLENNLTKQDETNEQSEKLNKYLDIIISHISAHITT